MDGREESDMTKGELVDIVHYLHGGHPHWPCTSDTFQEYWEHLSDMDHDEVKSAVKLLIRVRSGMIPAVDIRERVFIERVGKEGLV